MDEKRLKEKLRGEYASIYNDSSKYTNWLEDKIIELVESKKKYITSAHMAGQNNQTGCDPSWGEAHAYYMDVVEEENDGYTRFFCEGKETLP
jgi:hypothetical protein